MFFNQRSLTTDTFLRDHWQRNPLLLRQAFPEFRPLLGADDIAGLACDELAESRLITGRFPAPEWTLRYGPFDGEVFQNLPERDWTLLVQDVEKHYPPLGALLADFSFLPRWRIDDVMVSVAGPGGSVGPHVDQYDVFLLQATGRRRWEISASFEPDLLPDCELNVLRKFTAEQSWELSPGDMLYLPPGIAHHGVAMDPEPGTGNPDTAREYCMTWSIGMRAPSAADLLQSLGEWLAESSDEGGRYRDPDPLVPARSGQIDRDAMEGLRRLARDTIDDETRFTEFLGVFLSRYRLAHEPAPPRRLTSPQLVLDALQRGARLRHHPWTRLTWLETPGGALLFAAGSVFSCGAGLAAVLCDPDGLQTASASRLSTDPVLLSELINRGHLLVETL
jgi:50S ribosomal protein L16 3-hydroxylase